MTRQLSKIFLAATGLIATLCITSLPSIANAETSSETWIPANKNLTQVGEAFTKNRGGLNGTDEVIFTSGSGANGLLFQCVDSKLRAIITTKPQSWQTALRKKSIRATNKTVSLSLDGAEATNIGKFTYKPTLKTLKSHSKKQAVHLYNAVVLGQTMTIDMGYKGSFDVKPPMPNGAFADFGGRCGIGRNK